MEMLFPSSSWVCSLGGPALLDGLLGVCMKRSTKDKAPLSTERILKRLSSFQAAFSSSAMCPALIVEALLLSSRDLTYRQGEGYKTVVSHINSIYCLFTC